MYRISDYTDQFDVVQFLEDHRKFIRRRRKLEAALEDLLYLPSKSDTSGVRGSDVSKPAQTLALKRAAITEELDELDKLLSLYDECLPLLTTREQDVITLFYSEEKSTPITRAAYCRKYLTNETDLYSRDKPEAIEHFRRLAEKRKK